MKARLFDAHCDTAFELWRRDEALEENSCHISLNKAVGFESYAQIFAFCSLAGLNMKHSREDLLRYPLEKLRQEVMKHPDRIAFAKNGTEIDRLNGQGRIAALLSMEGPELIGCNPDRLHALHNEGFVMTTLTWNANNCLAGYHGSDKGLTDQGKAFVRTAEELGIYLDVSHLSECAFWQLAEMTQRPILASHSNCRSLCDHSRNLTDDQLRAISRTGGVVGLNLYVPFLGENAGFEALQRHLEHMLSLCGENSVCLGGDLDGCDVLADGFRDLSEYGTFYGYLKKKGYSESLLDQIFYKNLFRLF